MRPQILEGPVNALKNASDSVTLKCVTNSNNCHQVSWRKLDRARTVYTDGIGMINNDTFPPGRYSVISTDGCHLTIKQLDISDSGRFSCVLLVDAREETKSSVLVVIGVREGCRSYMTSNALNQYDRYMYIFWTAIEVPAKSVEPSNVTLSFQNKAADETETTESHPQTVKTTLTGIARKENITSRVCRAFLSPYTADGFDNSTAAMDVCTTQQLIVASTNDANGKETPKPAAVGDSGSDKSSPSGYIAGVVSTSIIAVISVVVTVIIVYENKDSKGRLSRCIVGIAAAIVAAVIACLVCCRLRKKKEKTQDEKATQPPNNVPTTVGDQDENATQPPNNVSTTVAIEVRETASENE